MYVEMNVTGAAKSVEKRPGAAVGQRGIHTDEMQGTVAAMDKQQQGSVPSMASVRDDERRPMRRSTHVCRAWCNSCRRLHRGLARTCTCFFYTGRMLRQEKEVRGSVDGHEGVACLCCSCGG